MLFGHGLGGFALFVALVKSLIQRLNNGLAIAPLLTTSSCPYISLAGFYLISRISRSRLKGFPF